MEKSEKLTEANYMEFVCSLHKTLKDQNIILIYEGIVTQSITKAFASVTEQNVENIEESSKTRKRLYHVMVECLQNICKHADDIELDDTEMAGSGIFIVSNTREQYEVTTGNFVDVSKIPEITRMIDGFNTLDKDGLKQLYKTMMKESRLSDKGGAGLGLIDIIKKTSNKIHYHFEPVNEKTSFFIHKAVIDRE